MVIAVSKHAIYIVCLAEGILTPLVLILLFTPVVGECVSYYGSVWVLLVMGTSPHSPRIEFAVSLKHCVMFHIATVLTRWVNSLL